MSKERLEEVKEIVKNNYPPFNYTMLRDALDWLIEQAERAQKNAQDLEDMDRQLYREQQLNKRYREALEEILTLEEYNNMSKLWLDEGDFCDDIENLARKALEGEE